MGKIDIPLQTPVFLSKNGVQGSILFMDMFSGCTLLSDIALSLFPGVLNEGFRVINFP